MTQLDLDDEETFALLNLLTETIESDRYPLSPRIQALRRLLAKFGRWRHRHRRDRRRRKSETRADGRGRSAVGDDGAMRNLCRRFAQRSAARCGAPPLRSRQNR